ncbi:MAG TPA: HD domain-containing phosphohydrolase [Anaerolineales bacterium]|nr:HD domain-containing phosphohydrolase [Anaerolineales bacterium]
MAVDVERPVHDERSTLLVVEDDPAMLVALRDILEGAGYTVLTAPNGRIALEVLSGENPALILSDISMPIMDGIELFEAVRKTQHGAGIPFIFLTARGTREDIFAGKSLGADDYITKPITSQELLAAVQARLQRSNELMLLQLQASYKASLRVLANAIESRDSSTRDHVERVNAYAQAMARELGWDEAERSAVEFGAILHDIGKIAVRESILVKRGPLTPEEWEEMRMHPTVGKRMIEGIPYLAPAMPLVQSHHERWDGRGYPEGHRAESIPKEARLLAVVDTFDAMTSDRPYHRAMDPETALAAIVEGSGTQFDPAMVAAFMRCWERGEILRIFAGNREQPSGS